MFNLVTPDYNLIDACDLGKGSNIKLSRFSISSRKTTKRVKTPLWLFPTDLSALTQDLHGW